MNKAYEFTGVLYKKLNAQLFKSGSIKQTVIICDDPDAKYVNYIAVDFWKTAKRDDVAPLAKLLEGEGVKVSFYPNATESQKNPGSWFSSNRGVEIKPTIPHGEDEKEQHTAASAQPSKKPEAEDDMPF